MRLTLVVGWGLIPYLCIARTIDRLMKFAVNHVVE